MNIVFMSVRRGMAESFHIDLDFCLHIIGTIMLTTNIQELQ